MKLTTLLKAALREPFRTVALLQRWPWIDTLRTLLQRFREDRLAVTASSLTFTTLISLVPLATVMLALFSAFPIFASFQVAVQKYFLQMLIPDTIARTVLAALTQFAAKASRLGSVGLAFLMGAALALMLTIDRTLNAIWRVPRPRPIAQRVLVYWAGATLGPLMLGASLTLTSYIVSGSRGLVRTLPGGVELALDVLEFSLLAAAMTALFHYVPNTTVRWRHAFAGGLFVAAGFEVARNALGWYLRQIPTYAMVYGAFATVPIFLSWIYLGWVIVLLGAVIAAYAPSLQMRVVRRPDTPGAQFQLAVTLLRALDDARRGPLQGRSVDALSGELRVDPLQIGQVLDLLVDIGWVGRLDEAVGPRHVLLGDPAATSAGPLVARMLVERSTETEAFWQGARLDAMTVAELIAR